MSVNNAKVDKYKCNLCNKVYTNESGLRKHRAKKFSCIPQKELTISKTESIIKENQLYETVQKLLEENIKKERETQRLLDEKEKETKRLLDEKEKETKGLLDEKEREIIRLKTLMEHNIIEIKDKINENNYSNKEIKDELINVSNKIESTSTIYNNNQNYNLTQNNDNKKLNFNIQLSQKEKERFDHIPVAQMLSILDQKDFSRSIADLVQAVSFNPKAPENMTWCVSDKRIESGAIEYNHDLNVLTKSSTKNVITQNLQNILFPATDIFKQLETTSTFNNQQNQNYDRYFDLLGELDIKKEYINSIKEVAYDKRGLCKALWEHLQIGLHIEKIRQKTKTL